MPNNVKLQEGHPISSELRPIKVGDESTSLEVAKENARVRGNFENTGDMTSANFVSNSDRFRFGTSVGFDQIKATFDATDTIIDFTVSNKQILTLTNNVQDVHFKFPAVSGNFLCIVLQDGTGGWDVSNWKTQDFEGNAGAGNSGVVRWAGGTATSLTETADKADIVSVYWDATNEMAYAVASENF